MSKGLSFTQVFNNQHPLSEVMIEALSHEEGVFRSELELQARMFQIQEKVFGVGNIFVKEEGKIT